MGAHPFRDGRDRHVRVDVFLQFARNGIGRELLAGNLFEHGVGQLPVLTGELVVPRQVAIVALHLTDLLNQLLTAVLCGHVVPSVLLSWSLFISSASSL